LILDGGKRYNFNENIDIWKIGEFQVEPKDQDIRI